MKFTNFVFTVCVFLAIMQGLVNSNRLNNLKQDASDIKQNNQGPVDQSAPTMAISNYDAIWKTFFGDSYATSKASQLCTDTTRSSIKVRKLSNEEISRNEKQYGQFPQEAPYLMYKSFGFDDAAYLFDNLDSFLIPMVKPAFDFLTSDIKNAPYNKNVQDPYDPQLLINLYSQFKPEARSGSALTGADVFKRLAQFNPHFTEVSRYGIRVPQVESLFNKYQIPIVNKSFGWEKAMVDKYDKNGDGILSLREAIFMVLWEGRKFYDKPEFLKNLTDNLDPIFKFIDCDNDGFIHAEGFMKAVQNLKLPDSNFNMFSCVNPKNHQPLHTNSFSDIVLKNSEQYKGMLNKHEFRSAIILGMWDRLMIDNQDFGNPYNAFNQKPLRWDESGKVDKMCPYK